DEETDQRFIRNTIEREATRKGLQKGLKQGLKEGRRTLRTAALNLLEQGLSQEQIASACDMTVEELNRLLDEKIK
ncbi:MAG: hypothetical protein OSJ70_04540, partial [Bacilli bacterium]|nr:hypothetical protein [Bacilli bacterium]